MVAPPWSGGELFGRLPCALFAQFGGDWGG
jgi:hypothetical protein